MKGALSGLNCPCFSNFEISSIFFLKKVLIQFLKQDFIFFFNSIPAKKKLVLELNKRFVFHQTTAVDMQSLQIFEF